MRLVCPYRCWPLLQRSRAPCSSACVVRGKLFQESDLSRLDHRSGVVREIRRQIVPNNSVKLPIPTAKCSYVMSPHMYKYFSRSIGPQKIAWRGNIFCPPLRPPSDHTLCCAEDMEFRRAL